MKKYISILLVILLTTFALYSCSPEKQTNNQSGAIAEISFIPIDIIKALDGQGYDAELLISDNDMASVANHYRLQLDDSMISKIYCVLVLFPLEEYYDQIDEEIAIYIYCDDTTVAEELKTAINDYVFGDDFSFRITNPIVSRENSVIRVGSQNTFNKVDDIIKNQIN